MSDRSATLSPRRSNLPMPADLKVSSTGAISRASGKLRSAVISKQEGSATAFNLAALERPDLALRHQQLLKGKEAGAIRSAV